MLIRAAEVADAAALVPLFEQWGHPLDEESVRALLTAWRSTARAEVVLAEPAGAIGGVAAVSAAPHFGGLGMYARLAGLVVAETWRRHGVGAALLEAVEVQARAWSCDRLELTSSWSRSAAHAFYTSRGYEETSRDQARYQRRL